jgi:predicted nuclease with TOPRIM domain
MLNNILFIAIGLLLLAVVIFAFGFIDLIQKFKEIKEEYQLIRVIVSDDQTIIKNLMEREEILANTIKSLDSVFNNMEEINKINNEIVNNINNNYAKLLECWKDVDDNFEASTEQFRNVADQLFEFKKVLEPWCIDADNLGENIVSMNKIIVNPVEPMINGSENTPKKKTTRKKKAAETVIAEEEK